MYQLCYRKIPDEWICGLPVGNGRLAAMYWGNETKDILTLNHEYLWRGKFRGKEANKHAEYLPLLRKLLKQKDYYRANVYANLFFGNSGNFPARIDSYQPAGDLIFTYAKKSKGTKSVLDITDGTLSAERKRKVSFETFCDADDGLLLSRWKSDKAFSGKLLIERAEDAEAEWSVNYKKDRICFDCRFICGISYRVEISFRTNGKVTVESDGIGIDGATELITCTNIILSEKDRRDFYFDYDEKKKRHQERFSSYMNRVEFSLGQKEPTAPIDERILAVKDGKADDKLLELYFHYGRYLMISSCISGALPPNLQGKWNNLISPPWMSDYHFDINLQMNEWVVENTNLSEFAEPLTDFMLAHIEGGRKMATNLWGCRGICLPLAGDVWAECTPESFGYGVWVGAAAWMAQPLWKHYLYTGDKDYLREKAYRFFKEVALFFEDFLVEDENGVMQIMPSQSPENRFVGSGNLTAVSTCISSAMDVQLAYDAFEYAIRSAQILDVDREEADRWAELQKKLPPFAVGSDGRLLEWNEEFEEAEPGHRHLSHLYGLFPGDLFTEELNKEAYDAAIQSFYYRLAQKSGYTGWSRAWISNICARIGDADGFYEQICGLLKDFATASLLDTHPNPKGPKVLPDVFEIDGNFGFVSACIEALCCFMDEKVHLLRALPASWSAGHISGIKLPGGHEIEFSWKDGTVDTLSVILGFEQKLTLVVDGKEKTIAGISGETIKII